jgi:hypothetical protein
VSTPNPCEVRGIIASKQGLSCSGYFTLANRTAHLRERLYVTVRDGDKLFLPRGNEHFPVSELERHYIGRMNLGYYESIGAQGGEVVFICEGPASDEGATVIEGTLASFAFEELLTKPLIGRWAAAVSLKRLYLGTLRSESPPYRPPVLPERPSAPEPVTEEERASTAARWRCTRTSPTRDSRETRANAGGDAAGTSIPCSGSSTMARARREH